MKFEIDPAYLTDVTVTKTYYPHQESESVTADQLMEILKSLPVVSTSAIDHPEFTRLREQLESEGYVCVERAGWNGDRVLLPFSLNGHEFQPGDQFSCAPALGAEFRFRDQQRCKNSKIIGW